ncbi:MAG TPA: HIT domain-containing protein [Myxococcota bacterium]|nr:HIT domain-containing protein [Myxococcota bacterium]
MKQIWAPWRMQYILGPREDGCVFCFDPSVDRSHHVLKRTQWAFVLLNKFPYTNGHLLVVPARHVARPRDLDAEEYHALSDLLLESIAAVEKILAPHGLNVGMNLGQVAGAGVDEHMHYHVVPRWSGDHNYMAVLGEVRMINEHLEETFLKLKPAFEE